MPDGTKSTSNITYGNGNIRKSKQNSEETFLGSFHKQLHVLHFHLHINDPIQPKTALILPQMAVRLQINVIL